MDSIKQMVDTIIDQRYRNNKRYRQWICSNCNLITDTINRLISQKYKNVKCNQSKKNQWFKWILHKIRHKKSMFTNQSFCRHLQFFDESCFLLTIHYGTTQSGQIYRRAMKNGDLNLNSLLALASLLACWLLLISNL